MAEETLRQYLDRIHIEPNDTSTLVICDYPNERITSRRYLECKALRYLLDYKIVDFEYPYTAINGVETIKLVIEK